MPILYEIASHVKNCHFGDYYYYYSFQLVGGVHKLNEINSLTQLHIISHKTVEIIKMKMFVVV